MTLDLFAKTFGAIWRLLRVSSMVSLLTPMSRRVTKSVVSRKIGLAGTTSRASGMVSHRCMEHTFLARQRIPPASFSCAY